MCKHAWRQRLQLNMALPVKEPGSQKARAVDRVLAPNRNCEGLIELAASVDPGAIEVGLWVVLELHCRLHCDFIGVIPVTPGCCQFVVSGTVQVPVGLHCEGTCYCLGSPLV